MNPAWLCPELLATEHAKRRLAEWRDGGGLERPPLGWFDIYGQLAGVGDVEILRIVVGVLTQVAPPARDHVLRNTWVLAVGRQSHGWCTYAPPSRVLPEPLRLIAISGARDNDGEIATCAAHEIAHAWLDEAHPDVAALSPSQARDGMRNVLSEIGDSAHALALLESVIGPRERRAADLARAWGFHGQAANSRACEENTLAHAHAAFASGRHDLI